MSLYIGFFTIVLLFYFAVVGDAYYHASRQLLSDTKFVSSLFMACEMKGGGADGHAEAILEGIKNADVSFRFLGTVPLDYQVVIRIFGSLLLGVAFALMPYLLGD